MRVCQFRHDGIVDLHCSGGPKAAGQEDLHFYSTDVKPPVKPSVSDRSSPAQLDQAIQKMLVQLKQE